MGPVAPREEELLHLRVPTAGLVAEVNTGLQKRLHGYSGRQTALLCVEKCPQASISGRGSWEQGTGALQKRWTRPHSCDPQTFLLYSFLELPSEGRLSIPGRSRKVADIRVSLPQGAPVRARRRLRGTFRARLPVLRRPLPAADQPAGRPLQGLPL